MEQFERRELTRADHVLAVSDADRSVFETYLPAQKVDVIATGVNVEFFQPLDPASVNENNLVFTGSMDWLPNEEGLFYFVKEILSLIRQSKPDVTLTIVGRRPSERLKAMAERDGQIQVTGRVEDIRPYVEKAAVYIVPLRVGSGTRLKIFEAMAMGQAIVSTTLGAEGLPVKDGENILLRDDSQSFANAVLRLLNERELRSRLGRAARKLVEESYSWAAVARDFEKILDKIISREVVSVTDS
jgi:glycosyltransferase involved in cell wall biosynthesis